MLRNNLFVKPSGIKPIHEASCFQFRSKILTLCASDSTNVEFNCIAHLDAIDTF